MIRTLISLLALLLFTDAAWCQNYELPPVLKANQVLPAQLVRSKYHTVDQTVTNNGYINTYIIHSAYRDITARGLLTLEMRIHEIAALTELTEKYPSDKVVTDAAVDTGEKIVTAPIHAVGKAVDTLSDTEKLKKLPGKIVGGVQGIFSVAASAVQSGADFVYETGKNLTGGGNEKEKDESEDGSSFEKAADFVTDKALDYTGYNQAAREIMQRYSIDPYTDNEALRAEVRRIAGLQASVGFAGRFVPGVPSLPYLGTFNRYMKLADDISAYDDPAKLEKLNKKILSTLGGFQGNDSGWDKRFMDNPAYTPYTRAVVLSNLEKLKGVSGKTRFVKMAAHAKDRESALYYVTASQRLADIHLRKERLQEIIDSIFLPASITKGGTVYVPLPVDHLVWTEKVAGVFTTFRSNLLKHYKVKRSIVEIDGTISDRCRDELVSRGVEVRTNVRPEENQH